MASCPPVILIGMHRSGTTLIARMLESVGVFMGYQQDENAEAQFFLKLNGWLFRQSGAAWDRPLPVKELLQNPDVRDLCREYLQAMVFSTRAAYFLGPSRYKGGKSLAKMRTPWGWKDPRNTFTLPLWMPIFPGAKVIHVYRNGVDVARSLAVREQQGVAEARQRVGSVKWPNALMLAPMPGKGKSHVWFHDRLLFESVRVLNSRAGFALWEEYVTEAEEQLSNLNSQRVLQVCYEDFVANAAQGLRGISEFLELETEESTIASSAAMVNKNRAHNYRSDVEWNAFFDRVSKSPSMSRYGYR